MTKPGYVVELSDDERRYLARALDHYRSIDSTQDRLLSPVQRDELLARLGGREETA